MEISSTWKVTIITQICLCVALFVALNIGHPMKHFYRSNMMIRRNPNDFYFISVGGGFRPFNEQTHLLNLMGKVIKLYNARFVVNVSQLGEDDPLLQNDKEILVASILRMETMASASIRLAPEPANYDEVYMHQSLLFSNSLEDLKNLRNQLYLAAEYFEKSFTNDNSKEIAVDALKAYTIKALVSTVDHLGSVSYKVNDLLSEKIDQVSVTNIRVSHIEQRLRTCQAYIDQEGLSQQSLVINTPKHHKHYILPVGATMHGGNRSKAMYEGCNLDDQDDWRELKNAIRATVRETPPSSVRKERSPSPSTPSQQHQSLIISGNVSKRFLEKRTVSPHRFPLLRFGSFSSRPVSPNSRSSTPNSRSTTPNLSRPTTPNLRQGYLLESRKSVSMRHNMDGENSNVSDHIPSKSKRLLKALLTKRRLKKDDTLYTYLDEY